MAVRLVHVPPRFGQNWRSRQGQWVFIKAESAIDTEAGTKKARRVNETACGIGILAIWFRSLPLNISPALALSNKRMRHCGAIKTFQSNYH